MRTALLLALVSAVLACSDSNKQKPAPASGVEVDRELLRTLAVLATSKSPADSELDLSRRQIASGELTVDAYIDGLLRAPEFARDVVPVIVFGGVLDTQNQSAGKYVTKTETMPEVYYLREPCNANEAVPVRPWWDMSSEVLVCPDAYQPGNWSVPVAKRAKRRADVPAISCLSDLGLDDPACGCGPNMIRCYPTKDRWRQVKKSFQDELKQTVAKVVTSDLPLSTIYVSNETWRDRDAEAFQRGQVIEAKQMSVADAETYLADLPSWPAEGQWAPRENLATGQHAGVLTAPQLAFYFPDRRQRMSIMYDVMWCAEPSSLGASPESIMSIAGKHAADFQLRQDAWKELAARPICTTCHARLDYGLRFFRGYGNTNELSFFLPSKQLKERGGLYMKDIDDPRGEGELTPQGFAALALAQPEYTRCVARSFAEYVLGGRTSSARVDALATKVTKDKTTARQLMHDALLQLVDEWPRFERAGDRPPVPGTPTTTGDVVIAPAVRTLIDTHCVDCHTESGVADISANALPRALVVEMLDAVAFGRMPKDAPFGAVERAAILEPLIAAMWSGEDAKLASGYYVSRMRALTALRPDVTFTLVHQRSGATSGGDWRIMERSISPDALQASPGMITQSALESVAACKKMNIARAAIDTCIERSLRLEDLVVDHP